MPAERVSTAFDALLAHMRPRQAQTAKAICTEASSCFSAAWTKSMQSSQDTPILLYSSKYLQAVATQKQCRHICPSSMVTYVKAMLPSMVKSCNINAKGTLPYGPARGSCR